MAASATVVEAAGREVRISNPDKLVFPQVGHTKLDLVRYYLAVADGALRGVAGRPMILKTGEPFKHVFVEVGMYAGPVVRYRKNGRSADLRDAKAHRGVGVASSVLSDVRDGSGEFCWVASRLHSVHFTDFNRHASHCSDSNGLPLDKLVKVYQRRGRRPLRCWRSPVRRIAVAPGEM